MQRTRILLADDTPDHANLILQLLLAADPAAIITLAPNPHALLETADQQTFDCLILDDRFGAAKTPDLIRHLTERAPHTRVLVLSANNDHQAAAAARHAGAHQVLPKASATAPGVLWQHVRPINQPTYQTT